MKIYERVDDTTVRVSETIEQVFDITSLKSEQSALQERKQILIAERDKVVEEYNAKITEIESEIATQEVIIVEAGKVGVTLPLI